VIELKQTHLRELASSSHLVEEMVDDLGGEDLHALTIGELLCVALHLDVEGEDDGVLRLALQHRRRTHHVTPMYRTDVDAAELGGKGE
jgi:hypothetical protein